MIFGPKRAKNKRKMSVLGLNITLVKCLHDNILNLDKTYSPWVSRLQVGIRSSITLKISDTDQIVTVDTLFIL